MAQAVGVPLAAVLVVPGVALVAGVATPELASVYPQALENWDMDKVHYLTPAALRMVANRTPGLVLLDSMANTRAHLEDFEQVLMPAVVPASTALEGLAAAGLGAEEVEPEDIVEPLESGIVDYSVAVVALEQPFVVEPVEDAVIVDIVEGSFDYFVEQALEEEVLD